MASHGIPRSAGERSEEQIKQDGEKIEKYRSLEDQFRSQVSGNKFDDDTLKITTKLLRINPEYYTVWNGRRRCLVSGPLKSDATDSSSENEALRRKEDTIRDELIFTVPLLMQYPKCYWIWNYRMWTLEQATQLLETATARRIWQEELGLIEKMLNKDQRNFHAWSYRRYVVSQLESPKLDGQSLVKEEFDYTTRMIDSNLSNFSAWHNRAKLTQRYLSEQNADAAARKLFLDKEFDQVDRALNVGPEDQSLWYYHQYLISNVTTTEKSDSIAPHLTQEDCIAVLDREIEFIQDLLEDYTDIKWIYEALLEYTVAKCKLEKEPLEKHVEPLSEWLSNIKSLDQQRAQRWNDLARDLQVG